MVVVACGVRGDCVVVLGASDGSSEVFWEGCWEGGWRGRRNDTRLADPGVATPAEAAVGVSAGPQARAEAGAEAGVGTGVGTGVGESVIVIVGLADESSKQLAKGWDW